MLEHSNVELVFLELYCFGWSFVNDFLVIIVSPILVPAIRRIILVKALYLYGCSFSHPFLVVLASFISHKGDNITWPLFIGRLYLFLVVMYSSFCTE